MTRTLRGLRMLLGVALALCPLMLRSEQTALRQGVQAYEAGDMEKAMAAFTEAIRVNPKEAAAYFNRGNCHATQGDYDGAIADWSEAIRLDPLDPEARNNRGNAYAAKGEYDKAIVDGDEAIRLRPKFAEAFSMRGVAHDGRGEHEKAVADFNEAIQIEPGNAAAYHNRGRTYAMSGETAKALADYFELIHLNPHDAEAHSHLAWLLATCADAALRDGKKAVGHARLACEFSEWKNPMAIQTLAAACAESGDFAQAIQWQTKFNETPGLHERNVEEGKKRLALYEAHHPYHEEKQAR